MEASRYQAQLLYLAELVVDALGLGYWYRRGAAAPRGTAAAGECCRLSGWLSRRVARSAVARLAWTCDSRLERRSLVVDAIARLSGR